MQRGVDHPGRADTADPTDAPLALGPADPLHEDLVDDDEALDHHHRHDRWAWRRRLRERRSTRITLRIVVGALGTLLILGGLLTGPLPGPGGIPLVLLGLAVWASEFRWARRLMRRFRALVHHVRGWSRRRKTVAILVVVVIGWSALYGGLWFNGIPGWLPAPVEQLLDQIPGLTPAGHRG